MNHLILYISGGVVFVILSGTISHYVYDWSGKNFFAGFFFPVNESTWEHMKLLFFPMLIYASYMGPRLKEMYPGITSSLFFGILSGTMLIPIIFYTYTGILGRHHFILDIITFVLSVSLAFFFVYRLTLSCSILQYCLILKLSVFFLAVLFLVFTHFVPGLALFQEPETH